jgi:HPt (histidine-containing phosphotransfer) domain-containing protein
MQNGFYGFVRKKAMEHFLSFGFDDAAITPILEQGMIDLKNNMQKLEQSISDREISLENVAVLAHTIKGILANMGLEDIGMKFKNIQFMIHEGATEEEVINTAEELMIDLLMLNV